MNTEELKIIMDALVQLGEAGKSGFIWWLILKYGAHYFTVLSLIVAVAWTVRVLIMKVMAGTHGNQLGLELCGLLNTKDSEYRGWDNEVYRATTKAEIINRVRELLANQRKEGA